MAFWNQEIKIFRLNLTQNAFSAKQQYQEQKQMHSLLMINEQELNQELAQASEQSSVSHIKWLLTRQGHGFSNASRKQEQISSWATSEKDISNHQNTKYLPNLRKKQLQEYLTPDQLHRYSFFNQVQKQKRQADQNALEINKVNVKLSVPHSLQKNKTFLLQGIHKSQRYLPFLKKNITPLYFTKNIENKKREKSLQRIEENKVSKLNEQFWLQISQNRNEEKKKKRGKLMGLAKMKMPKMRSQSQRQQIEMDREFQKSKLKDCLSIAQKDCFVNLLAKN